MLTPDQRERLAVLIEAHKNRIIPFPSQDKFVDDGSRFIAALCTRRAGKSNGLARRFIKTLQKYPGSFCPYIALTRDSAKNIMWDMLHEHCDKNKILANFTDHNLTMTHPNGARLQLFGADMKNFIRRLKGIKTPGCAVDEAQDLGGHIERLVDEVLTPTISDYSDGWLALTGTPGPIPNGFFYDVTEQGKYGYSVHRWSIYENPYFKDAEKFVNELKVKKAWPDDYPTLLREWHGKWVKDSDALVIKYDPTINHFTHLPELPAWQYVIGIDIGFDDADAIAVIGWSEKDKRAYLIEEHLAPQQGITELAHKVSALIEQYQPLSVVMDTGGLGKKIAEEIRRRYALPIKAAEKDRKFEFIELLNDALRTKRLFAKSSSIFAADANRLEWDNNVTTEKLKVSDKFHSDIIDAVLYAFRESLHWLAEPDAPTYKPYTDGWFKQEEKLMEKYAEELVERNKQGSDNLGSQAFENDEGWY